MMKLLELKSLNGKRVLVETTGLILREESAGCTIFSGERSVHVTNSFASVVKAMGTSKPTVCGD